MAKFELWYPLKPILVTQGFGVNGKWYQDHGINIIGHNGIDFMTAHGEPIYAAHDGTAYYEEDANAGQGIVIVSDEAYDYKDQQVHMKSIYWHMVDYVKEPAYRAKLTPVIEQLVSRGVNSGFGVKVKTGDIIGYADNTGLSTGDHLHFGIKPIVPSRKPVTEDATDLGIGDWVNVEANNGYTGAIDPTPYWNRYYAVDSAKTLLTMKALIDALTKLAGIYKLLIANKK